MFDVAANKANLMRKLFSGKSVKRKRCKYLKILLIVNALLK